MDDVIEYGQVPPNSDDDSDSGLQGCLPFLSTAVIGGGTLGSFYNGYCTEGILLSGSLALLWFNRFEGYLQRFYNYMLDERTEIEMYLEELAVETPAFQPTAEIHILDLSEMPTIENISQQGEYAQIVAFLNAKLQNIELTAAEAAVKAVNPNITLITNVDQQQIKGIPVLLEINDKGAITQVSPVNNDVQTIAEFNVM